MAKMFRKRSKTDSQMEYTCSVRFLDDEPMQFTFKKDTIGQWLFDRVCEEKKLMEKDYFGLRYVDSEKQRHWLDPLKTVYKQMKGVSPMVLCFRVKFYPEDPSKLHEEITRYYLFLQLRRDLHHGRLLCSPDDAVSLAAYIVQSEVGDYDLEDHPPGYISEFKMLPKQTPKLEDRVMELHKSLHGQVPSEAESNFLKKACTLDTYGVDPHQVKDQRGDQLYLGITHQGIMTFRGSRRTQLYKWSQIRRIAYEGKMFIIHININEKQQPVGYKCLTPAAAKYLWRCAVEQQLFFTLSTSNTAPKMRSGGTLFTRGSKFRFSGRCQTEAYEASEHIRRSEPNFQRSSSLPNFARRNPESRNSTISHRDSALSDSIQEDRRSYQESAVDVPRVTADRRRPASEVEPSPVVKAPLAAQENFDEFQKQQQQQQQQQQQDARQIPEIVTPLVTVTLASPTTATPPRMNGQVVTESMETPSPGDHDISLDTTMTYQPDSTFYDEEEDSGTKPSLEEEIQQLDEHFNMIEQNHISAQGGSETPSVSTTSPPPPESVPVTEAGKKHEGGSICKAIVVSLFVALLLFSVLFYILFFSGLDHPVLTEMRNHLQFLDPVQDYVSKVVKKIPQYFSN